MPGPDPTPRLRGRAGVAQRERRLILYPLCRRCNERGIVTPTEIINHIVPLAAPFCGPDTDDNCEGLCKPCDVIVTAEQFGHRPRVPIGDDGWPKQH
jgi:5-methylcytosine-specific restriction endonuclease McrA